MLARGSVERIGTASAVHTFQVPGRDRHTDSKEILEHRDALTEIVRVLTHPEIGVISGPGEVHAVGHRMVHGGEHFTASALATPEAIRAVQDCIPLAPL